MKAKKRKKKKKTENDIAAGALTPLMPYENRTQRSAADTHTSKAFLKSKLEIQLKAQREG